MGIDYCKVVESLNLKPDEDKFHRFIYELDLDPSWFTEGLIIFERLATVQSSEPRTGLYEHGNDVVFKLVTSGDMETHYSQDDLKIGTLGLLLPYGQFMHELPEGFSRSAVWEAAGQLFPDPPAFSFYTGNVGNPPSPSCYDAFLKMATEQASFKLYEQHRTSGAFLYGDSFTGKTTSVMHFMLQCATFEAYKSWRLGCEGKLSPCYKWFEAAEFAELAKNKAKFGQTMEWIAELVKVKFLIIDDMDKFQLSESVEVAFFDLLKRRIESRCGFTIITSNQSLEKFVKRFAIDRRKPIENRLKQFFRPFKFIAGE